jgi:branched-chain amino acid transport system substrate-binding protein
MADRKKYKIGVTLPTSGYEERHGRTQWLAAQLAVEETLPKLGLPFDVELAFADDGGDATRAVPVAHAFAADAAVLGVVGPMNTDAHLATGDIYEAAGLAHIGTAASNPTLSQRGWRTFFRVVLSDIPHYKDAARYAVQALGARRIAVLNDGSGFTRPMAEGFRDTAQQLGAEIPAFIQVVRGREDYSEAVAEMARVSPPPDIMFFVVIEPVAVRLANPLRKAGVRVPFFATDGLKPLPYFATPDYPVDGPYYTNVCVDHRVKEPAGAMVRRYVARFGEEPTVYVAEGYDATAILLTALQRAGASPNRESVRREVAATRNFPGTTGSVSFDAHGDIETPEVGIYKYDQGELRFLGFTKDILSSPTMAAGRPKPR